MDRWDTARSRRIALRIGRVAPFAVAVLTGFFLTAASRAFDWSWASTFTVGLVIIGLVALMGTPLVAICALLLGDERMRTDEVPVSREVPRARGAFEGFSAKDEFRELNDAALRAYVEATLAETDLRTRYQGNLAAILRSEHEGYWQRNALAHAAAAYRGCSTSSLDAIDPAVRASNRAQGTAAFASSSAWFDDLLDDDDSNVVPLRRRRLTATENPARAWPVAT